jgi:hypothetical protein
MTERISKERNETPFLSQTTLEAFRLTLLSIIDLTEDLLSNNYDFVLTGKFNQDCIEVMCSSLLIEMYVNQNFILEVFRNNPQCRWLK